MPLGKCKGVVKFTIPFRDKIWGVKTPSHILDKCDFTLIY